MNICIQNQTIYVSDAGLLSAIFNKNDQHCRIKDFFDNTE